MNVLKVFSSEEMKAYDTWVNSEFKIPESTLVEHAGRECFKALLELYDLTNITSVLLLCGSGGNGADGLVLVRLLQCFSSNFKDPISIEVFLTKPLDQQRDLNRVLVEQLIALGVKIHCLDKITQDSRSKIIRESDIIIDALLGTGVSGLPIGNVKNILEEVRDFRSEKNKLIAIDLPSGLNANSDVMQDTPYIGVQADNTFVIQDYKMAHMAPGSERYCGESVLLNIGMPMFVEEKFVDPKFLLTSDQVQSYLDCHGNGYLGHKGQRGHILVVGGSESMTGAPILSSLAAFKVGAGKVTTTLPINKTCTEATLISLPLAIKDGCYEYSSIETIRLSLLSKQAVVIGPGLGLKADISMLLKTLLEDIKTSTIPCVLDADALTLLAQIREEELISLSGNFVLTPHVGEFLTLEKAYFKNSLLDKSRYEAVKRLAIEIEANILLKGPKSLFFDLKSGAFYNPHQAASLAVAGSGDVLSGLMAGLFARGYGIKEGAIISIFLHGFAGEILDGDFIDGVGVDAKIILESIPGAYRELLINRNANATWQ